jgi:hypothetical protein
MSRMATQHCFVLVVWFLLSILSAVSASSLHRGIQRLQPLRAVPTLARYRVHYVRGGQSSSGVAMGGVDSKSASSNINSIVAVVTISLGNRFTDKSRRFTVRSNMSILEFKTMLETKYPGCPPVALQRLWFGTRVLKDDDIIGSLSSVEIHIVPITLDVLPRLGFDSYVSKLTSTSRILEAYSAVRTYQTFLENSMQNILDARGDGRILTSPDFQLSRYRQLIQHINKTIYEKCSAQIAVSSLQERSPILRTSDTHIWIDNEPVTLSPAAKALANYFDMNWSRILELGYYSALCWVRATGIV